MKPFYFLLFLIISGIGNAQDITAYKDYRNYFMVFDKGVQKEIETLTIKNYKIGQTCIAYQDYLGHLKAYYKTKVYDIYDAVEKYYVSKNFALALSNSQLKIFDHGKMRTLSTNIGAYALADSIVAFHDNGSLNFNAYYKGTIYRLEDLLVSDVITTFKAGGNMLAYIDNTNDFKMFYHSKITTLFSLNSSTPLQYEVGQDVVAYINDNDQSFHVYWSDQNYSIEDFNPLSFQAGNNYVAYVDNTGQFKIFSQGMVTLISAITPDFYFAADDIIVYSEKNCFKAYYKGLSYDLEKYIPKTYQYDQGCIAYTDNLGQLVLFKDAKKETVSYDVIKDFALNGSLLKYTTGNQTKIYYKGKTY